ncbi:MAG: relaxase domain-containing protein [Verrucomicrobia bacterium]|nr:relaxase domain-containing protein [Verrucomicrobiota bacterium]
MLTISPIYLEDAEAVYAGFFQDASREVRLTNMGYWQGTGSLMLRLTNPLQLDVLGNLLKGRTPDGAQSLVRDPDNPNRVAGWRVMLTADPSVSAAWAVAPPQTRIRVERGFVHAVRDTLNVLEVAVAGGLEPGIRPGDTMASLALTFAVFRTKTARDLSAQLQATAIIPNLSFDMAGEPRPLAPKDLMHVESSVREAFHHYLMCAIQRQLETVRPRSWSVKSTLQLTKALDWVNYREYERLGTWSGADERRPGRAQDRWAFVGWRDQARALARSADKTERATLEDDRYRDIKKMLRWGIRHSKELKARAIESLKHLTKSEDKRPARLAAAKDKDYGWLH